MIYKAVEVIWIFSAGGRTDRRTGIEGSIRGPRGPKKQIWGQAIYSHLTYERKIVAAYHQSNK